MNSMLAHALNWTKLDVGIQQCLRFYKVMTHTGRDR